MGKHTTGTSWDGIKGIVEGAGKEPPARTRRLAENAIYSMRTDWRVEIVRLPLPAAPISEHASGGVTFSPAQVFPTLAAALLHARKLVQQGYGLRMTGPDGQVWDDQQVRDYLNGIAMKQPALRAEDGAEFHGRVDRLDNGQFRASCNAVLDHLSEVRVEVPEYRMVSDRQAGVDWIMRCAAARGFTKWIDENPPEGVSG